MIRDASLDLVKQSQSVERYRDFPVVTSGNFDVADTALKLVVSLRKAAEDKRRNLLRPLKEWIKTLEAEFNVSALVDIENQIRRRMEMYAAEEMRSRLIKQQEAYKRAEKTGNQSLMAVIENTRVPLPRAAATSFREEWDFDINDTMAVPREYLSPDPVKIRAYLKSLGQAESPDVPGVSFFKSISSTVKRG